MTVAGAPVTLTVEGVKLNAVRVGAIVSLVEVMVSVVGPFAAKSEVARTELLPAASPKNALVTVHVPASLNRGKAMVVVPVTEVAGVKVAEAS